MSSCCETGTEKPSSSVTLTVALAGNPNSGKTTIFNALTGLRQKVANYPGVTVEKKTGRCKLADGTLSRYRRSAGHVQPHQPIARRAGGKSGSARSAR